MQFTTSKGETFESSLTDQEAAAILSEQGKNDFARDLATAFARGRLTVRQRPWLHKLAMEIVAPVPRPSAASAASAASNGKPASFPKIPALLAKGGEKLKFPKLTLDRDGQLLRLTVAGAKSKYAGSVMVTDGRAYPGNTWFGSIAPDGTFTPSRSCTPFVTASLTLLDSDPAGFAAAYGKSTGACCFCNRELSTPESTTAGYGPVCAENFGLPWGE